MLQVKLRTISRWNNNFFPLLSICKNRQDLRALNSVLITHGLFSKHQPVITQFIDQCLNLGYPELALPAFETIEKPSLSLQNALIKSLCGIGLFENVFSVYRRCRDCGVVSDCYTCPFVIKACAVLNSVCFGKMMHCLVFRTGFVGNIVVQTSLLDFYSKIVEMNCARRVFDEIPQPDSVAWNALISGFCVNRLGQQALKSFRNMHADGVKANASTLACVLPACSHDVNGDNAVVVQGLAQKLGFAEDPSLAPSLISIYANRGNLSAARIIFSNSTSVNLAMYNAMISSYTKNQNPENAAAVFRLMLRDGLKPNMVTFLSLIPSSVHLSDYYLLESFHGFAIKFGQQKEPSLIASLLSAYAKLGDIKSACIHFSSIQVRSLLLWNSMVSAYANSGLWKESLNAFHAMQIDGVNPDAVSVISLLTSCSRLNVLLPGKAAQGFSLKRGIDLNLNASNAFLAFYCNCEEGLDYAFRIFNRMDTRDVVSWNTMISACIDRGDPDTSVLLFHQMRLEGTNFDLITLISILPSCNQCNNGMLGLAIYGYAIKTGLKADIPLSNALISMYVNGEELDAARSLLDDMPHKSIVSWNAMLTGYRYHDLPNESLALFNQMIEEDREKPNYLTLVSILPACRFLPLGKSVHAYSLRTNIPLETSLLMSLIIMYGRHKDLKSGFVLFHMDSHKRSICAWNALLTACLLSENYTMGFTCFNGLLQNGIEPDNVTILNVIATCAYIRNTNITNSILSYLTKAGFDRDVAVNNALIDLYAKSGNISRSRAIFDTSPHRNEISWGAMINGYGLHGKGESALALYTQMRIEGLKPDKATYLSVLSACSHGGLVEQGRMVLNDMILDDQVLPGVEHYLCMADLLGRTGHLNEAYEIVKGLLPNNKLRCASILESLLGACLYHGDYALGEEIGRLVLEMSPGDSGTLVILYNVYAAAGKWADASNVRLVMEQKQLSKTSGVSVL